jgi:hypothetical protein
MKDRFPSAYGSVVFSANITIPNTYDFENQTTTFIRESIELLTIYGPPLNDEQWSRVSTRLAPGEHYRVEVVPIEQYISNCQQCLNDLKQEDNIAFVGMQGLILFTALFPKQVPQGHLLSFDLKEHLHKDEHCEKVPYMYATRNGKFELSTINFWSSLGSRGYYVLLFYKI